MIWKLNVRGRIEWLLLLLCVSLPLGADERIHYLATYSGVFSMGEQWQIADLVLENESLGAVAGQQMVEERLQVSSANFPFVEAHFPFRIRYRELLLSYPMRLLAIENYQKTRKLKHQVTWYDQKLGRVLRFRKKGRHAGRFALPPEIRQWLSAAASGFEYHKPAHHRNVSGLLGQLSLLRRVRQEGLSVGRVFEYPVSDGKQLYRYRVTVERYGDKALAQQRIPAWKLKFQGYEQPGKEPAHRAVFVWLADDAVKTPLAFEIRHTLGLFSIQITDFVTKAR